jgi:excisionase family DNA binding protein
MKTEKLALSIEEAVAVVGIGRTTLYQEIRSGSLLSKKVGRRTVILTVDLIAWLHSRPSRMEVHHD